MAGRMINEVTRQDSPTDPRPAHSSNTVIRRGRKPPLLSRLAPQGCGAGQMSMRVLCPPPESNRELCGRYPRRAGTAHLYQLGQAGLLRPEAVEST